MQQYELAEQDYIAGMKYKEIAEKHNVTINTVKSWKTRYGWIRGDPSIHRSETKKSVHTKEKSVHTKEDKAEVGNDGLTDKQRIFAIYYVKQHNATRAYLKAYGGTYEVAAVSAHRLLKNPNIKSFIDDLRKKQLDALLIREEDIVQRYVDIIYADPLDYVNPKTGKARTDIVDGSIIQSIMPTKNGAAVKLPDKLRAMEKLQQYFDRTQQVGEEDEEKGGVVLIGEIREDYMDTTGEAVGIPEQT